MDEAVTLGGPPVMERMLQRIQDEAGLLGVGDPPAYDPASEGDDHEGDAAEARLCGDIGEVGEPERVRPRRLQLPVQPIFRTERRRVAPRRLRRFAAHGAGQAHLRHQTRDHASGHIDPLAVQLPPHLALAIDLDVLSPDPIDLRL